MFNRSENTVSWSLQVISDKYRKLKHVVNSVLFLIYRIGQDWIRSSLAIGIKWIGTQKKIGTVGLDICITSTAGTAMLVKFVYFSLNETVQHTLSLSNGKKIMFICRFNRVIKNCLKQIELPQSRLTRGWNKTDMKVKHLFFTCMQLHFWIRGPVNQGFHSSFYALFWIRMGAYSFFLAL